MKKSKIFARKIVAIVLSVLMAASSFTGALTAFAKSVDDNHDSKLAANFMAWAETTDNQTCEAILDWADETLKNANIAPIIFEGNYVVVNIQIHGYLDSIDGVIDLARQAQGLLSQYGGLLGGDVNNIDLSPLTNLPSTTDAKVTDKNDENYGKDQIVSACNRSYRAVNDAKTIVMALAEAIYRNSNDNKTKNNVQNKNVIGQFVKGNLSLGSILNGIVDVYGLIGDALGMWSGYQSNLVYNILAQLILTKTNWFTEAEVADFQSYLQGNGGTRWNFDEQLFSKLTGELMNKISVTMTYAREKEVTVDPETGKETTTYKETDSSKTRYAKIKAYLEKNGLAENDLNIAIASDALGYDVNLRYDYDDGMVYIFRYGTGVVRDEAGEITALKGEKDLNISKDSKVYDLLDEALGIAWYSVLKPTLQTVRANDSMDYYEGHGGNFDNTYNGWLLENGLIDETDWTKNYTTEKFNKFAEAKYKAYGCADADEFTEKVKTALTYDRKVVDDPTYTWRDVDKSCNIITEAGRKESILFGKLRYSPLADKVFGIQTGPINLYIMETGTANLNAFIEGYIEGTLEYDNIIAALNDGLVAAVKDFFPDSKNIGLTTDAGVQNIARPVLATTENTTDVRTIATTLVSNVTKMFEYAANVTDENLLNPFYHNNNKTDKLSCTNLTEGNFEEAMVPLLIACVTIVAETRQIHITDWDYAKDAEGVGYVALREYLSYVLPTKNYDALVTTENGYYEAKGAGKDLYLDVILPMARDAVGYLLNSVVPCRDKNGNVWDVYKSDPATDTTTLFDLLNSVICYYASTEEFTEPSWNTVATKTYGKGVASLLGVVDGNGNCTVKMSNSLWTNISNIANAVWPTIGVLQFGDAAHAGKADAEELIYNRVVKSLLNIGEVNETTGEMGITTILMQLLTMFTAEPIMNKGIDVLVYDDVVASLVNSVFGSRINGQYYSKVIPTSTDMGTTTPFDSLVSRNVIALYKGDQAPENGVLGILISNLFGILGGTTEIQNSTQGNGAWQGAMFAVKAVSYFIDGFIPQLNDHQFKAATISVNDPSRSNIAQGTAISATNLTITNNASGLNRFYKNAEGKIVADDRYFIEIQQIKTDYTGGSVNFTIDGAEGKIVAPEESIKLMVKGDNPSTTSTVTFEMTYDVYLGDQKNPKKQLLAAGQTASCFLQLSANGGWAADALKSNNGLLAPRSSTYYTSKGTASRKNVYVYNDLIIENTKADAVNKYGLQVSATGSADGLFAVDEDDNIYVAVDSKTGDIVNIDRYDYKLDTDTEWRTGETVSVNGVSISKGYTYDETNAFVNANLTPKLDEDGNVVKDAQGNVVNEFKGATRVHVALAANSSDYDRVVADTQKDGDTFKTATVKYAYNNIIIGGCATASTPTQGITFVDFKGSTSTVNRWLKCADGATVDPANYAMALDAYIGTNVYQIGATNVIIANTSGAADLQKVYDSHLAEMAPYQATDYNDVVNGASATYENLNQQFKTVVGQINAPITKESASKLVATTETVAKTSTTESTTGDWAYMPLRASEHVYGPAADSARTKDGYWYTDSTYRFPIYGNRLLNDYTVYESTDAQGNKILTDAVGQVVVKGTGADADKYLLVNDVKYETAWTTEKYDLPYLETTNVPAVRTETVEVDGEETTVEHPQYNRVQYVYYAENGMKVGSADNWVCKVADTEERTKENDGTNDYRGYYEALEDALYYYVMIAKQNIKASAADTIATNIIKKRANLSSVDYKVDTYEKMVQIGRNGEALVYDTGKVDEEGSKVYATSSSTVEINEAVRLFNKYFDLVQARGYEGDKLEAEIQHLIGTTADKATATVTDDAATVTVAGTATPDYGKLVGGKLVNEGAVVYTDETWNNYVVALANAINAVRTKAKVSEVYEAKKAVVRAENALREPEAATDYILAGKVTEAIDGKGTAGTSGIANVKIFADGKRIGTTNANGEFTVSVPLAVTEVKFEVPNGFDRTITTDGATTDTAMNVGVVAIDFNNDGKINTIDVALGSKLGVIGKDKQITGSQFVSIMRTGVNYAG